MKPFSRMTTDNTALIIIDVINSCAHDKCEIPEWGIHFTKVRSMVPKLSKFIDDYRKKIGGLVIFGKTVPWNKEYLADNVNELYEDEKFAYYRSDETGFFEDFYGIKPTERDLVVDKNTNDALANPKLRDELSKRGIKYLIVTGVFTDACVLATVSSGFSQGYSLVVIKDLVETTDLEIRQAVQKHLLEFTFPYIFARVVDSKEILDGWGE